MKVDKLKMLLQLVIPAKAGGQHLATCRLVRMATLVGISLAILIAFFAFIACTDYVQQIDDRYGEWNPTVSSNVSSGTSFSLSQTSSDSWVTKMKESSSSQKTESSSSSLVRNSQKITSSSSNKVSEPVEAKNASITDSRDGHAYKVVTIGSQTWMAENLNYKTDNSYCYNGDVTNCSKYGRLYTWTAAMTACPNGWLLPNKTDWNTLFNAVGGQSTAGKVLKSMFGWYSNGNGLDSLGFSALPAGYWYNDGFFSVDGYAGFWSAAEVNSNNAYGMSLFYDKDEAYLDYDFKTLGFSVRCLMDDEKMMKSSSSSEAPKSSSSQKMESSSSCSATLPSPCKTDLVDTCVYGVLTDSRDAQKYKTVVIGLQTWMAENLNYEMEDSFCYGQMEDNPMTENCTKYGRLYTWAAAMSACPKGRHLPDNDEWNTLFITVGGSLTAGINLKSMFGWLNSGNGSDSFGFSALPAGGRSPDGDYDDEGGLALFWSATKNDDTGYVYDIGFFHDADYSSFDNYYSDRGFSVRCLQD